MEDQPVVENEKLDRRWRTVRCAPCGNLGHNKKSCIGQAVVATQTKKCKSVPVELKPKESEVSASGNQRSEVVTGASQLSNVVGASQSSVSCACQSSLPSASQLLSAGAS
ncbi:hypothetical protein Tco_0630502 [Tanacetum coccineum]